MEIITHKRHNPGDNIMWFKAKPARDFLLENGFVFTLKPYKSAKDAKHPNGYFEPLFDNKGNYIGKGFVVFIKEIKDDSELLRFVRLSGFDGLDQWLSEAKNSRVLYYVWLYKRLGFFIYRLAQIQH